MSRIAYVNGRYRPHAQAVVHVEDRGYQFADGVYEVCEIRNGGLVDERLHLARLQRSLSELRIAMPVEESALRVILRETVRRNRVHDGIVYLQITRGVARRDHAFPLAGTRPSLVVTARRLDRSGNEALAQKGIDVITLPDTRWARVDIKSVALLPNVLAKQAAREQGAKEAWFVDDAGMITEGSSTNAWIVTAEDRLVTRQADRGILRGVTRTVLLQALGEFKLTLDERAFSTEEAYRAREAFVTSASLTVMPVVRIDGRAVGEGRPGRIALGLRQAFHRYAQSG